MKKALVFGFVFILIGGRCTMAQSSFYDIDTISEVRVYFSEPNWDHLLDSMFVDGLEARLQGSITVNGIPYDSVGVRYKGYSSASVNRIKNPLNIKLDYVIAGQNHEGYDKIKLSNVIQDPSFVREALSYEIARKYMPASEANFANVYINDTLIGLYTNVESVGKEFLLEHFGSKNYAFFKGNPESLDLNGENSNLSNSPGTDTSDYQTLYDMKSDTGWLALDNFIDVLNNDPANVETVLNVDRALWMHAFNYALINFDSYVGYAQNYYVYQDHNGQFNPIIWDLNMSFASFRLADASDFWDGFTIAQAKTMDPLAHYNSVSVYPRPLMRNLFDNDMYRRMYLAHLRTIVEENFDNQLIGLRAIQMQNLIDASVALDSNKFYSYQYFIDNLTMTVTDLVDYPGITEMMDGRTPYINTYPGIGGSPAMNGIAISPPNPVLGDDVTFSLTVTGADNVYLAYRYAASDLFSSVEMLDDGNNGDGGAGDDVYGVSLTDVGNIIDYYFYSENSTAGRFSPGRAAYEYYTIESTIGYQDLVINEFMAINNSHITDENGDYDDWIELYNPGTSPISTKGLYLSDNTDTLTKWAFPDVSIGPNEYLIVWADQETDEGNLHASMKLTSTGEQVTLAYGDSTIIDSVSFIAQGPDISWARSPNGSGAFGFMDPTFGWNNDMLGIIDKAAALNFELYPNPSSGLVHLVMGEKADAQLRITSYDGREIDRKDLSLSENVTLLDVSNYSSGLYLFTLSNADFVSSKKLIVR